MPKPNDVGRDAENKVCEYLRERGYVFAQRPRLKGANDEGDIYLGDGYPVVIEVKGGQKALANISSALKELADEIDNAGAEFGFVVLKKARSGNPAEWYAVVTLKEMVDVLIDLFPPR